LAVHKEETLNWIIQGKLTQPTLLIWGYNDPTALLKRGHALFEIIADGNPNSEMHIINQAGHFCYHEQPDTFNQVITGFVKSARAGESTALATEILRRTATHVLEPK
jgi:pimeloyl-ACP methyl ester carboxylesterase